jgi:hypothetical protein
MNESFKKTIFKASNMIRVEAHGLVRVSLRILPGGVADAASFAHAYSPQSQEFVVNMSRICGEPEMMRKMIAASSAHAYSPQSQELIYVKNLWRT